MAVEIGLFSNRCYKVTRTVSAIYVAKYLKMNGLHSVVLPEGTVIEIGPVLTDIGKTLQSEYSWYAVNKDYAIPADTLLKFIGNKSFVECPFPIKEFDGTTSRLAEVE